MPRSRMSAGLSRVGLTLDGETKHGARPPRRQGSAASKHDTSSNTLDTALAATAVVLCRLNAGESGRLLRPAKQRGHGR